MPADPNAKREWAAAARRGTGPCARLLALPIDIPGFYAIIAAVWHKKSGSLLRLKGKREDGIPMHRLHFLNALLLILLVAWPALAAPPLQGGNRLQNGNFEGGFSQREAGEVVVANGWERWWQDGTKEEQADGFLKRPEYKPDSSRAGGTQQKFFTNYATHNGGIYQRVGVPRGSKLTLTARAYVWSNEKDNYDRSDKPGNYVVMVGIDPTGGTNALAGAVVWSPGRMEYDHWLDMRVEATAQADAVTVFLRDASNVIICAIAEHVAATGRGGFPSNAVAVGNSTGPSHGYILDAGEELYFLFGAAQGAAAFIHAPVLEIDM